MVAMTAGLYAAEAGGEALCGAPSISVLVAVEGGSFHVLLGADGTPALDDALLGADALYLELEVDGNIQAGNSASIRSANRKAEHIVVARADGYATETVTVRMDQSRKIDLRLQEVGEAEAPPAAALPRARRRKKGRDDEPLEEPAAEQPAPAPAATPAKKQDRRRGPRPGDDLKVSKKKSGSKTSIDNDIPWQ